MIEIALQPEDYSAVRFCTSPIGEAVLSVRILQDRARHALYLDWIHQAAASANAKDLAELRRLIRPCGYLPDFLTPPPDAAHPDIEQELRQIRDTPCEQIVTEVGVLIGDGVPPTELKDFLRHPKAALERYLDALWRYWNAALAKHWARMASVLDGDIVQRAHLLAVGGAEALFNSMHPALSFDSDQHCIRLCKSVHKAFRAQGTGLRLIPRMFAWPDIYVVETPAPISIAYPPRGLALWGQIAQHAATALTAAFGEARARVLLGLATPTPVTELAARLAVTKSAVSQHLGRLSAAVTRRGGYRYYYLSRRGEAVVHAFGVSGRDAPSA